MRVLKQEWSRTRVQRVATGTALLLAAANAMADTPVSADIASTTQWTVQNSPYVVSGAVSIVSGASLEIQPGVIVRFAPGASFTVASGALSAQGTAQAPIVFTSINDAPSPPATAQPGDWGVLTFADGTNDANTVLNHVQIRYGHGVQIHAASPRLDAVSIDYHDAPAITLDLASSPVGRGLSASHDTLNGILVPAGVMTADVSWHLTGIAYVVAEGQLEIGLPPFGLSPQEIQIVAGESGHLSVNLPVDAPAGGVAVALSSANTAIAQVPAQVSVPAGQHAADVSVSAITTGDTTIAAQAVGYAAANAHVVVLAQPPLTFQPNSYDVGYHRTRSMTLHRGGTNTNAVTVTLSAVASTLAGVPASVNFIAGATDTSFTLTGAGVGNTSVHAQATGYSATDAAVHVHALNLSAPVNSFVAVGQGADLVVGLSDPAPVGGLTLSIDNDTPGVLGAPASVHANEGDSQVHVPLTGLLDSGSSNVHLTFSATDYSTAGSSIAVHRIEPRLGTTGGTSPVMHLPKGTVWTMPVQLSKPAPAGGVTIALSALTPGRIDLAPATVTIAAGEVLSSVQVTVSALQEGEVIVGLHSVNVSGIDALQTIDIQPAASLVITASPNAPLGKGFRSGWNDFSVRCKLANEGDCDLPYDSTVTLSSADASKLSIDNTSLLMQHGDALADIVLTGVNTTTQPINLQAHSSVTGIADANLGVSVVAPAVTFPEIGVAPIGVGLGQKAATAKWNVGGQRLDQSQAIVVQVVAASPSNIVDGLYANSSSSAQQQLSVADNAIFGVGAPTAAGHYRLQASVTGLGTWQSAQQDVNVPAAVFEDASLTIGEYLSADSFHVTVSSAGVGNCGDQLDGVTLVSSDLAKLTAVVVPGTGSPEACGQLSFTVNALAASAQTQYVQAKVGGVTIGQLPVTITPRHVNFRYLDGVRSTVSNRDDFQVEWVPVGEGDHAHWTYSSVNAQIGVSIAQATPSDLLSTPAIQNNEGGSAAVWTIPVGASSTQIIQVAKPLNRGTYRIAASVDGAPAELSALQNVSYGALQVRNRWSNSYIPLGTNLAKHITLDIYTDSTQSDVPVLSAPLTIHLVSHAPAWVGVTASATIPAGSKSVEVELRGSTSPGDVDIDAYLEDDSVPALTFKVRVFDTHLNINTDFSRRIGDPLSGLSVSWQLVHFPCDFDGIPSDYPYRYCPDRYEYVAVDQHFHLDVIDQVPAGVVDGFVDEVNLQPVAEVFIPAGTQPDDSGSFEVSSNSVFVTTALHAGTYKVRATLDGATWMSDPVTVGVPVLTLSQDPVIGLGMVHQLSVSAQVDGRDVFLAEPLTVNVTCANPAICTGGQFTIDAAGYTDVFLRGLAVGSTQISVSAAGVQAEAPRPAKVSKPVFSFDTSSWPNPNSDVTATLSWKVPDGDSNQSLASDVTVSLVSVAPGVLTVPAQVTFVAGGGNRVPFTLHGASPGSTAITATAPGFDDGVSDVITVSDQ